MLAAQAAYDLAAAGPTVEQLRQVEAAASARGRPSAGPSRLPRRPISAPPARRWPPPMPATSRSSPVPARAIPPPRPQRCARRRPPCASTRAPMTGPSPAIRPDRANPASLALEKATNDYTAAKAAYDAVAGPADAAELSAAAQQVAAANPQLDRLSRPVAAWDREQAQANLEAAEARLAEAKAGAPDRTTQPGRGTSSPPLRPWTGSRPSFSATPSLRRSMRWSFGAPCSRARSLSPGCPC